MYNTTIQISWATMLTHTKGFLEGVGF